MRRGVTLAILAGWMVLAAGCAVEEPGEEGPAPAKEGPLTIAVCPKGTMHVFWKSIHAGARQAEKELNEGVPPGGTPNVKIIWQGPVVEDDREAQVNLVETFIQKRVDGIVLAPLDLKALVGPVRRARQAGIPVVIIDSALADEDAYVSFVATDNYKGGVLGAQRLAELLGPDGGKAILLRYQVGSASTENRERGFLEEIAKHEKVEVVSSDQYAGATVETAMNAAQALLTKYGKGQVDGVFCPNESSAYGMLRALVESGRAGKIHYVGFDASDRLVGALKNGHIKGLVVQNPFRMGHDGVATVVKHLRGQDVPKRVDTGVTLVTSENLDEPEIQKLVHPPLE